MFFVHLKERAHNPVLSTEHVEHPSVSPNLSLSVSKVERIMVSEIGDVESGLMHTKPSELPWVSYFLGI